MDHLLERLERLEQHTHTVERRLRWWRGLACGLAMLGLLGWGLPLSLAKDEDHEHDKDGNGVVYRVEALEKLLQHVSREENDIFITGANLHLINGLGATKTVNGLGNLIVGYNEPRVPDDAFPTERTGSHNVVVGPQHNFSSFGGLVVGEANTISGYFASVSGGQRNTASGYYASVSGGVGNTASNYYTSVSGGIVNTASGSRSFVTGGAGNHASGDSSSVIGGDGNTASGNEALVSGGAGNLASGEQSVVSAGQANEASNTGASVTGGEWNEASGFRASISGGMHITQATDYGWAAGSEGLKVVVGHFRSP